jgi:hypothetical protein
MHTPGHDYLDFWKREFSPPDDRRQYWAQFLKAVKDEAPEVLRALRDDVLPIFDRNVRADPYAIECELYHFSDGEYYRINHCIAAPTKEWLRRFKIWPAPWRSDRITMRGYTSPSGKYNSIWSIPDCPEGKDLRWLIGVTWETLCAWVVEPIPEGRLAWRWSDCGSRMSDPEEYITFSVPSWDILRETRADAELRMLESLEKDLKCYLESEKRKARDKGLTHRPRTWTTAHFEWLVRYQVLGESYGQIAKSRRCSPQNCKQAIAKVAKAMVGPSWKQWLRPPGLPGRPRKRPERLP